MKNAKTIQGYTPKGAVFTGANDFFLAQLDDGREVYICPVYTAPHQSLEVVKFGEGLAVIMPNEVAEALLETSAPYEAEADRDVCECQNA